MSGAPPGLHRQPGDAWVACRCGSRHWGLHGAAGLLLARAVPATAAAGPGGLEVVLQHRVAWSDQGGTWGVPGGALAPGEDAVTGAVREAVEEAGLEPAAIAVVTTRVLDHGDWSYTTVVARATGPQDPRPTDAESEAVTWVPLDAVPDLPLHSAFAEAWPSLRTLLLSLDP